MLTRQPASDAGTFPAPGEFVRHLRDRTGDPDLFCWWCPEVSLDDPEISGRRTGCWVIWQKQRRWTCVEVDGGDARAHVVNFIEDVWVDVMRLDGSHGTGLDLGSWVIQAMVESQRRRIHTAARSAAIKDAKYRKMRERILKDHAETDYAAQHYKDAVEAVMRTAGVRLPMTIREERVAAGALFNKRRERRIKRAEQYGRDVSV